MNSLERIAAAVKLEPVDRVPVFPQVFGHAARLAGVPLRRYLTDGEELARCQVKAWKYYDGDALFALMDVCVETEALGSSLSFPEEDYPDVETYALDSPDQLSRLAVPDPETAGRMPQLLRAIRILAREVDGRAAVIGCVLGPLTLTAQLLGIEPALYLAVDHPQDFEAVLDFATEVLIRFGISQVAAGAHFPLVFEPCGSPSVVPPQFFRELLAPRLARLFASLKNAGALCNWLHIAGPATAILSFYPQIGVEIANIDYEVEALAAQKALPHTCIDGNIKSLDFVNGTPEDIEKRSRELIDLFAPRGGFILSAGCEIPPESKPENILAMVAATR